jgi:hypothetical protein
MSIDDSRIEKMNAIRHNLREFEETLDIKYIDGRVSSNLEDARKIYTNVTKHWMGSPGEEAIWYGQMNAWKWAAEHGDLLVIEDDAMVELDFAEHFKSMIDDLPDDWDFFSVFIPDNQQNDFYYNVYYDKDGCPHSNGFPDRYDEGSPLYLIGSDKIARVYQGYSCVATLYSQRGAEKLLSLVDEYGIYTPVDCFLFIEAHRGHLNGYTPRPDYKRIVFIDWNAPSLRVGK